MQSDPATETALMEVLTKAEEARKTSQRWNEGGGSAGKPPAPPLKDSAGGGIPSAMPDDALKPRVDFLQTAFLWLAGALVTAVIGVIAIAVTMTNATNTRLDKSNDGLSALNREVGQVSIKVDDVNKRLDHIDQKLDQISAKLEKR